MNSLRMLERQEENHDSTDVTWEDQQQINTFSKLNTRLRNLEEKLNELKREKEALEDLSSELELVDEEDAVLYKVGETFLHLPHTQAVKRLENDQAVIDSKVSSLASSAEECEKNLKELKVALYAKFGSTINLDE